MDKIKTILFFLVCAVFSAEAATPSWVDVPQILPGTVWENEEEYSLLDSLLKEYQEVEKREQHTLPRRIVLLESMQEVAESIGKHSASGSYRQSFFLSFSKIAANKACYLQQLDNLREIPLSLSESSEAEPKLSIKNTLHFNPFKEVHWGLHTLEVLDPCHRELTEYYLRYQKEKREESAVDFFLWLEGQFIPPDSLKTKYLTADEREKLRITFKEGLLCSTESLYPTSTVREEGEAIFVIDVEGQFFLAEGSNEIKHTSLSLGKPVLAAGNLVVTEGRIEKLAFDSGHYQPSIEESLSALELLEKMGADFDPETNIGLYCNDQFLWQPIKALSSTPVHKRNAIS